MELCRRCLLSGDRKILEFFSPRQEIRGVSCDLWWNSEPCKTCLVSDFITPTLERFGKVKKPPPIKVMQHPEFRKFPACSKVVSHSFSQFFSWNVFKFWSPIGLFHGPRSCQEATHAPTKVNRLILTLQRVTGNRTARNAMFLLGLEYQPYSQKKTGVPLQKEAQNKTIAIPPL